MTLSCPDLEVVTFPAFPNVRKLGPDRRFVCQAPYRHQWTLRGVEHRLTVPTGFTCDLASVPRLVWSFYPPGPLDKAAGFHDLHYARGGIMLPGEHEILIDGKWVDVGIPWTRTASDVFFRDLLDLDPEGPGRLRRRAAYQIVRAWGGGAWQDRPEAR